MKRLHFPKEDHSMAETVNKNTTKPKPKSKAKTPAKPKAEKKVAATNGVPSNVTEMKVPHERVAQLAHQFWAERGHQHGHHEEDWYRAEQELRGKAS
jgi:hypothetical protein